MNPQSVNSSAFKANEKSAWSTFAGTIEPSRLWYTRYAI
jgi:hypothetical protein